MKRILLLFIISGFLALSATAQSPANTIQRPCPNTTTNARVSILVGGDIQGRSCKNHDIDLAAGAGITSGVNGGTADGGAITLTSGAGAVTTQAGQSGQGGTIYLQSGAGGSSTVAAGNTSGNGGNATIKGGDGGNRTGASGTAGNGGDVTIDGGSRGTCSGGCTNGTYGTINIGTTNAREVDIGRGLGIVKIGDLDGSGNGAKITVDDTSGDVTIAGSLNMASPNVTGSLTFITNTTGIFADKTTTAGGTTGNRTINKMAGTVNFAAGASAITVTNSLVNSGSYIFTNIRTADATCTFVKSVVPGSSSFVITLNSTCTAETSVAFLVIN